MTKLTLNLAVAGFLLGVAGQAQATDIRTMVPSMSTVISAQEDCKEGETWNEETQKCEVTDG